MSLHTDLPLFLFSERLAICRLPADASFPDWARDGDLLALVRTPGELSIVCAERYVPPEVKAERGWRALQVQGPLDFSLVGVLASIMTPLTQAGVSVFVLSTYDTDYILVRESALERALQTLGQAGFLIVRPINHDGVSA